MGKKDTKDLTYRAEDLYGSSRTQKSPLASGKQSSALASLSNRNTSGRYSREDSIYGFHFPAEILKTNRSMESKDLKEILNHNDKL